MFFEIPACTRRTHQRCRRPPRTHTAIVDFHFGIIASWKAARSRTIRTARSRTHTMLLLPTHQHPSRCTPSKRWPKAPAMRCWTNGWLWSPTATAAAPLTPIRTRVGCILTVQTDCDNLDECCLSDDEDESLLLRAGAQTSTTTVALRKTLFFILMTISGSGVPLSMGRMLRVVCDPGTVAAARHWKPHLRKSVENRRAISQRNAAAVAFGSM